MTAMKETSVMEMMMESLVRKMSSVFGREEKEVREAVNTEMNEMVEAYKTWTKAMTTSASGGKKVTKEKVVKEKVVKEKVVKEAKVPKEKVAKAAKAPKEKKVEDVVVEATNAEGEMEVVVEVTSTEVVTEVAPVPKAKAPKAKVEKVPKAEKVPKEKAEKVPKAKAVKASKAKAVEVVVEAAVVVEEETETEEEEVEVVEMEYQGVKYLKSGKGVVYDAETSEEVGMWNEETQSIEVE